MLVTISLTKEDAALIIEYFNTPEAERKRKDKIKINRIRDTVSYQAIETILKLYRFNPKGGEA